MKNKPDSKRREVLKKMTFTSLGLPIISQFKMYDLKKKYDFNQKKMRGNINHSVCKWCYNQISLEDFAAGLKPMGISAIDLIGPKEWPILKKYGLTSSMCNGAEISLTEGWNDKQYHAILIDNYLKHIDLVADAGYTNLICFSGNRRSIDNETGINNCVEGLKKIMGHAEKKGVIIQMELLNSKIDL